MARPKQTIEEKLLIYQTKFKNALGEIALKDNEIELLKSEVEYWKGEAINAQRELNAELQRQVDKLANEARARGVTTNDPLPHRATRRAWQSRRRNP
jgi:hypothetical protein